MGGNEKIMLIEIQRDRTQWRVLTRSTANALHDVARSQRRTGHTIKNTQTASSQPAAKNPRKTFKVFIEMPNITAALKKNHRPKCPVNTVTTAL